jgi:hypothetical protein
MADNVLQNCINKVIEQLDKCVEKRNDGGEITLVCKICGNEDLVEGNLIKHIKLNHHFGEIIHVREMPKDNAIIELNWDEIEKERNLKKLNVNDKSKASGRSVSLEQVHSSVGTMREEESSEPFYYCKICRNQFIERNDVVTHIMTTHSYHEIEQSDKNEIVVTDIALQNRFSALDNRGVEGGTCNGSIKTFDCNACGKGFKTILSVKNHIESIHEKKEKVVDVSNDEDTEIIARSEYELDDIKAMKKKLEACDRELGLVIDSQKGATDGQSVYLNGDTATYEFMRGNIDEVITDVSGDFKVTEDKKNHKKFRVKTNSGPDAFVEEKRVFHIGRKKITATFYYTNSSIMFQSSNKQYPEFDNKTPAEWLSIKIEKHSKEIVKVHNMKAIVEKMRKSIEDFEKQEGSGGYGVRGKQTKSSNGPKKSANTNRAEAVTNIICAKCNEMCEKNGAAFEKCSECNDRQHLRCSLVKKGEYSLYKDGGRQITCFKCLIDPAKITSRLESITAESLELTYVHSTSSVSIEESLLLNDDDNEQNGHENEMDEILESEENVDVIRNKLKGWVDEAESQNEALKNKVKELEGVLRSSKVNYEKNIKVAEMKIQVLQNNVTSMQDLYKNLSDKYEKDVEQKTIEISQINNQFLLACNEREDLRNQKDTLEKLLNRIERENSGQTNSAIVDSHIPVYKSSRNKVIEVNDGDEEEEEELNREGQGLWTEVVRKNINDDTKPKTRSNKDSSNLRHNRVNKLESSHRRSDENDTDKRPMLERSKYCHFYNNSFKGCSNTSDECKFRHENAPACKSGENCRGIWEFRRCGFYHNSLSFLSQSPAQPRPPSRPSQHYSRRSEGRFDGSGARRY